MTMDSAVADRFELVTVRRAKGVSSFSQDVAAGLRAMPKRLHSKYLYDDVGSALFEAITYLPEYYLTRAETEILSEWGWQIVRVLDAPLDFLELGSGSAVKTRLLIGEALRAQATLRYSPIDISTEAVRSSSLSLIQSFSALTVRAYAGDYFDVLGSHSIRGERKMLAMLMGSNIGNYEPDQARVLIELLGSALAPGDGLLMGIDLKKDRSTLERAYDDPIGVTAAFDRNLLARINRELGADFDIAKFRHVVKYDEERGSVDSFLEARERTVVSLPGDRGPIVFDAGERMHTESSYKYTDAQAEALGGAGGFALASVWHDRSKRFSALLFVRQ